MYQIVAAGKVLVSCGPVELSIIAENEHGGETELALAGAKMVPQILAHLTPYKQLLKRRFSEIQLQPTFPEIVRRMVQSTAQIGDESFTPMAAVAGTVAQLVAEQIFALGATKVIVNNGGDIAIRLRAGQKTRVGLAPAIENQQSTHFIEIPFSSEIRGIASSGLGGRSFTKGMASVATVFATDTSLADVAATLVANKTFAESSQTQQVYAEELDPQTDLKGEKVTVSVGELSRETKKAALKQGLQSAKGLYDRGLISGAVIFVQNMYGMIPQNIAQTLQK